MENLQVLEFTFQVRKRLLSLKYNRLYISKLYIFFTFISQITFIAMLQSGYNDSNLSFSMKNYPNQKSKTFLGKSKL